MSIMPKKCEDRGNFTRSRTTPYRIGTDSARLLTLAAPVKAELSMHLVLLSARLRLSLSEAALTCLVWHLCSSLHIILELHVSVLLTQFFIIVLSVAHSKSSAVAECISTDHAHIRYAFSYCLFPRNFLVFYIEPSPFFLLFARFVRI